MHERDQFYRRQINELGQRVSSLEENYLVYDERAVGRAERSTPETRVYEKRFWDLEQRVKKLEERLGQHMDRTLSILTSAAEYDDQLTANIREIWERLRNVEEKCFPGAQADIDRIYEVTGYNRIDDRTQKLDNRLPPKKRD